MTTAPPRSVAVVIASRNRPASLRAVVEVLRGQLEAGDMLVLVDDGSPEEARVPSDLGDRVLRTGGVGPARARNNGWRATSSPLVAFTDDDVLPSVGWLEAARTLADADPRVVGMEGRTVTEAFDPAFAYSVAAEAVTNGLTCNIVYRRSALESVGGFDEHFPFPHCEDVDLMLRMAAVGEVLFQPAMLVEHRVRDVGLRTIVRRARWIESEVRLYERHPSRQWHRRLPPVASAWLASVGWPLREFRNPPHSWSAARARRVAAVTVCWWFAVTWWAVRLGLRRPARGLGEDAAELAGDPLRGEGLRPGDSRG